MKVLKYKLKDFHPNELKISSPAFQNEGEIPSKYTCDGEGINPPVHIENIPEGINTLALIVEDPDAPNGVFDHWLVWNIRPVSNIKEDSLPGTSGENSAGKSGYHPPCPPNGLSPVLLLRFCFGSSFEHSCRIKKTTFITRNGRSCDWQRKFNR